MKTEISDLTINFDITHYRETILKDVSKMEVVDALITKRIEDDILKLTPKQKLPPKGFLLRLTPNIFIDGYDEDFITIIIDNPQWATVKIFNAIRKIIDNAIVTVYPTKKS